MGERKVAVIGGGPAGTAVAVLLQKQGIDVTIFEREEKPKPIGAGIMLQPSGLRVLDEVGVYDPIRENGTLIKGLYGVNTHGKPIFDVLFDLEDCRLYGLGVHRASLFSNLYKKVNELGIPVVTGADIVSIDNEGGPLTLYDRKERTFGPFDATVVANGARSVLRKKYGIARFDRRQPYGALWCKVPYHKQFDRIHHVYDGTTRMVGLMPIGYPSGDHSGDPTINFFYGVTDKYFKDWGPHRFEEWKRGVKQIAPEYSDIVDNIESFDELTLTPYHDVLLKNFYYKNVVFIGDALHSTGPHLSSGTNLALMDGMVLSESFAEGGTIEEIFHRYQKGREEQVNYYHLISRLITPLFQSHTNVALLRNFFLRNGLKIGKSKRMMIQTIGGIKKGFFKNLDPKYYLCQEEKD